MTTIKKKVGLTVSSAVLFFIISNINNLRKDYSDITILNIEAIASPENEESCICLFIGSLDCPISENKVKQIIY